MGAGQSNAANGNNNYNSIISNIFNQTTKGSLIQRMHSPSIQAEKATGPLGQPGQTGSVNMGSTMAGTQRMGASVN